MSTDPPALQALVKAAERALLDGDLERAQDVCEKVLLLQPNHPEALAVYERAQDAVAQEKERRIKTLLAAAASAMAMGDFARVQEMCSQVLVLHSNQPDARALYERSRTAIEEQQDLSDAKTELAAGHLVEARRLVDEVLALNPSSEPARALRRAITEKQDSSIARARTALPSTIARYKILKRLGEGGMGSLYLARDPAADRLIAIKLLREDVESDELRERFMREAKAVGKLKHQNIVMVFDVAQDAGRPYIAVEYIEGYTLGLVIREKRQIDLDTKLKWIEELCSGLAHAHKQNIIHGDVKPANIMVDQDGTLKILDFGIARLGSAAASGMTQTGTLMGTLGYMSPEQITGRPVDQRSDIFAVGAVCYEIISYQRAFPGDIQDGVLHRIIHEPPKALEQLVPGVDARLVRIINRALEKDRDVRYQDLEAMRKDIARLRMQLEDGVRPPERERPAMDQTLVTPMPSPAAPPVQTARTVDPQQGRKQQIDRLVDAATRAIDSGEIDRRTIPATERIDTLMATAVRKFEDGAFDHALVACKQVLVLDPNHKTAETLLARAKKGFSETRTQRIASETDEDTAGFEGLSRTQAETVSARVLRSTGHLINRRYRVTNLIGRGGMGSVYCALDQRLDRVVAIKFLEEDGAEQREWFEREARMAACLDNPHIVKVFDVNDVNGTPFIVMEHVQGETLADICRRHEPIAIGRKLQIGEHICRGVAAAHAKQIIHRDIKPANIMVDVQDWVKIFDFGIARQRFGDDRDLTKDRVAGTPHYMSPEQLKGEQYDCRTDIFSVGAVLYELLTYRKPFPGTGADIFASILHDEPESVERIDASLGGLIPRIIRSALEKDVGKRYQDINVMQRELRQARAEIAKTH